MNISPTSTKVLILDAAAQLIRTAEAPKDVTVRKIIDTANVNLNAVNYHFGTKENLIREAVRRLIGDYFKAKGMAPGSGGTDLLKNISRISAFLFDEPIAAKIALDSELEVGGGGQNLTMETLESLEQLFHIRNGTSTDAQTRLRAWMLMAAIHACFLRPEGCAQWLGEDPRDPTSRERLLSRICGELTQEQKKGESV